MKKRLMRRAAVAIVGLLCPVGCMLARPGGRKGTVMITLLDKDKNDVTRNPIVYVGSQVYFAATWDCGGALVWWDLFGRSDTEATARGELTTKGHSFEKPGTYTVKATVFDDKNRNGRYDPADEDVESGTLLVTVLSVEGMTLIPDDDGIVVGGLDRPQYRTRLTATVSPAVEGLRIDFGFKPGRGEGVNVKPLLDPAFSLTDSEGKAQTTLTSGDLETSVIVVARLVSCGLEAEGKVKILGLTGRIYLRGKDITDPSYGPRSPVSEEEKERVF